MKKNVKERLNELIKDLVSFKKLYKLASERKETLTSEVKEIMESEGIETFQAEVGIAGINKYNRDNFDMKSFKAKYPEIYAEFNKPSEVVRLDVKEEK
jgi:predicted phage-related endonuclease